MYSSLYNAWMPDVFPYDRFICFIFFKLLHYDLWDVKIKIKMEKKLNNTSNSTNFFVEQNMHRRYQVYIWWTFVTRINYKIISHSKFQINQREYFENGKKSQRNKYELKKKLILIDVKNTFFSENWQVYKLMINKNDIFSKIFPYLALTLNEISIFKHIKLKNLSSPIPKL